MREENSLLEKMTTESKLIITTKIAKSPPTYIHEQIIEQLRQLVNDIAGIHNYSVKQLNLNQAKVTRALKMKLKLKAAIRLSLEP